MSATTPAGDAGKLGPLPFVIGGISFIPLVGIPFAITAIVWGLRTKLRGGTALAIVGAIGLVVSVVLYGGLFYFGFVQKDGVFGTMRARLAQMQIDQLVPAVEVYKLQHGTYPESLEALRKTLPNESALMIYDPSADQITLQTFFYERVGQDHYYLRGIGPDRVPFTADDILPQIAGDRLGLLKDRRAP